MVVEEDLDMDKRQWTKEEEDDKEEDDKEEDKEEEKVCVTGVVTT